VPQRLCWTGNGPDASATRDDLYVSALAAPSTITTLTEHTLLAFADHGSLGALLPRDTAYADEVLNRFERVGVNVQVLAERLQHETAAALADSWRHIVARITARRDAARRRVRAYTREAR
jgi:transaldolase